MAMKRQVSLILRVTFPHRDHHSRHANTRDIACEGAEGFVRTRSLCRSGVASQETAWITLPRWSGVVQVAHWHRQPGDAGQYVDEDVDTPVVVSGRRQDAESNTITQCSSDTPRRDGDATTSHSAAGPLRSKWHELAQEHRPSNELFSKQ